MNAHAETRGRAIRYLRSSWLTVVFTAVTLLMLAVSLDLSRVAGWIPRVILVLTLGSLLCQLVVDWRGMTRAPPRVPAAPEPERDRRATRGAAWIVGLLLATWLLGVIAGNALFCLAWLRWHAGERWPLCLAVTSGLGLVTWLVFSAGLGVILYPGVIGGF